MYLLGPRPPERLYPKLRETPPTPSWVEPAAGPASFPHRLFRR